MTKRTMAAERFIEANKLSPVVEGWASNPTGTGGSYRLKNGNCYTLNLKSMRDLPEGFPIWVHDIEKPETERLAAGIAANKDNQAVEKFAYSMRVKLAAKRIQGRGGWQDKAAVSGEELSRMLREHVNKGDPVDVANFCMMLHQRGEKIT